MAIIVKNESTGGDFYQVPAGTYAARCFSVIDMGTYPTEYQNKKRNRHMVRISWELPDEIIERDGQTKPATISRTYTHSLGEKATLRHDLQAWRGKAFTDEELKGFDLSKLLGVPCMLTITEFNKTDGGTGTAVSSVGKLAKGMTCKAAVNPILEYSVSQGRNATYEKLSEWMKEKLKSCLEWTAPAADVQQPAETKATEEESDPEIPF